MAKRSKSGFYPHTSPPKVKTLSLLYRLYARTLFFSFFCALSLILRGQLPIFGRLNEQHKRISRACNLGLGVNFADVPDNMSHFDNEILYDVRNSMHIPVLSISTFSYLFQSMMILISEYGDISLCCTAPYIIQYRAPVNTGYFRVQSVKYIETMTA